MRTLGEIQDIYAVTEQASSCPVEIISVADSLGERLTFLVKEMRSEINDESISPWHESYDLISGIRWHWSLSPGSVHLNLRMREMLEGLQCELEVLQLRSANTQRFEETHSISRLLQSSNMSPMAEILQEYLLDGAGMDIGIVLPRNYLAEQYREHMSSSFPGIRMMGRNDVKNTAPCEQLIFLGSPQLFGNSAWQAPRAEEQVFITPSWIGKSSLPTSELQDEFMHPYRRLVRHKTAGNFTPKIVEDPRFMIGLSADAVPGNTPTREDTVPLHVDEVWARQVTLASGHRTMLDIEGEQVRTIDPSAEPGQRVKLTDVEEVLAGSYLVLRIGVSESDVLRDLILANLGEDSASILDTHSLWKSKLSTQLGRHGERWVRRKLLQSGMRTMPRVEAWTLESTFGPRADDDFRLLMTWLDLEPRRFLEARGRLRSAQGKTTHAIRSGLEAKLSQGDMQTLSTRGALRIDAEIDGLAGMLASEVLAVSAGVKKIKKHESRVLKEERRFKWQE